MRGRYTEKENETHESIAKTAPRMKKPISINFTNTLRYHCQTIKRKIHQKMITFPYYFGWLHWGLTPL